MCTVSYLCYCNWQINIHRTAYRSQDHSMTWTKITLPLPLCLLLAFDSDYPNKYSGIKSLCAFFALETFALVARFYTVLKNELFIIRSSSV